MNTYLQVTCSSLYLSPWSPSFIHPGGRAWNCSHPMSEGQGNHGRWSKKKVASVFGDKGADNNNPCKVIGLCTQTCLPSLGIIYFWTALQVIEGACNCLLFFSSFFSFFLMYFSLCVFNSSSLHSIGFLWKTAFLMIYQRLTLFLTNSIKSFI